MPLVGNGLGAETLAAALDPEHQDSFGWGQAEGARLVRERYRAFIQPILQYRQAADMGEVLAGRVILEEPTLADDLLLLGKDLVDISHIDGCHF